MTNPQWQSRSVEQQVVGMPTSDGAGVKLTRVLTQNLQRRLDPFLMLDEFRSDNPGVYRVPAGGGTITKVTDDGASPQFGLANDRIFMTRGKDESAHSSSMSSSLRLSP